MEATKNRVYTLTIGNTVIENIRITRMDENALLADSPAGIIRLQWREEPQIDQLLPMPTLERIVSAAVAQCADDPLLQGRLEEIAALMQRNEREPLTAAMEQLRALRRRREVQLLIGKCACMLGDYRTAVREWNSACPIPAYAARAAWEARCMPLCQLLTAIIIQNSDESRGLAELLATLARENQASDGLMDLLIEAMDLPDQEAAGLLVRAGAELLGLQGDPQEMDAVEIGYALEPMSRNWRIDDLIDTLPDSAPAAAQKEAGQESAPVAAQKEATQEQPAPEITPEITPRVSREAEPAAAGEEENAPKPEPSSEKQPVQSERKPRTDGLPVRTVYPQDKLAALVHDPHPGDALVDGYFRGTLLRGSANVLIPVGGEEAIQLELIEQCIDEQGLFNIYAQGHDSNENRQTSADRDREILFQLGINNKTERVRIYSAEFSPEERLACGITSYIRQAASYRVKPRSERDIALALRNTFPERFSPEKPAAVEPSAPAKEESRPPQRPQTPEQVIRQLMAQLIEDCEGTMNALQPVQRTIKRMYEDKRQKPDRKGPYRVVTTLVQLKAKPGLISDEKTRKTLRFTMNESGVDEQTANAVVQMLTQREA